MLPPVFFVCSSCGSVVTADQSPGYCCPRRIRDGSGEIHRLVREVEPRNLHWPDMGPENPLLRYRRVSTPYLRFLLAGGSDAEFVERVMDLEARVRDATGQGFRGGPVARSDTLEIATGREGRGSVFHQDRSRFGAGPGTWQTLLFSVLPRWLGLDPGDLVTCPGADDASDAVHLAPILGLELQLVADLGSESPPGSRAEGLYPWTGWGDLNAWSLEGESLWAFVAVDHLRRMGEVPDRVFLPSAGGRSAGWSTGLRDAFRLGGLPSLPRIHVVEEESQTRVADRYDATLREILTRLDGRPADPQLESASGRFPKIRRVFAERLLSGLRDGQGGGPERDAIEAGLRAVLERVGSGPECEEILVRGMIESGGFPIVVDPDGWIRGRTLSQRVTPAGGVSSAKPGAAPPKRSPRLPGLASAGILQIFAQEELPVEEVLLVVDP